MKNQGRSLVLPAVFALVSLYLVSCGNNDGANHTPSESREATWGLLATDAMESAGQTVAYPVSVNVKPGTVSTTSVAALAQQDQAGTDDVYNRYLDLTPAR